MDRDIQDRIIRRLDVLRAKALLADRYYDWDEISEKLYHLSRGINDITNGSDSQEADDLRGIKE